MVIRDNRSRDNASRLYLSGPLESLVMFRVNFENRVPLKPVQVSVCSRTKLHYCTCTDSIKPSRLFSFLMQSLLPEDLPMEYILHSIFVFANSFFAYLASSVICKISFRYILI